MSERPHPLELEQWLLDEQTPEQRARTEARLDPAAREQLRAEDEALRAQLFARVPPERLAARVQRKPSRRALWGTLAVCALALLLFPRAKPAEERAKGQTMELRVYRQRDGGVERLQDGARVGAHELTSSITAGSRRAGD